MPFQVVLPIKSFCVFTVVIQVIVLPLIQLPLFLYPHHISLPSPPSSHPFHLPFHHSFLFSLLLPPSTYPRFHQMPEHIYEDVCINFVSQHPHDLFSGVPVFSNCIEHMSVTANKTYMPTHWGQQLLHFHVRTYV